MSEDHLIRYCAPTLAGIKTGSLFSCACPSAEELRIVVRDLNKRLVPKGLRLLPLRFTGQKALMYVYRPFGLRQDLSHEIASRLLEEQGYRCASCEGYIAQLSKKLKTNEDFPHEIGLFLGYPPEDVDGFIKNNACGFKCAGCWKVYSNVESAIKKFDQYRKCSHIYLKCWKNGSTLDRLTVSR